MQDYGTACARLAWPFTFPKKVYVFLLHENIKIVFQIPYRGLILLDPFSKKRPTYRDFGIREINPPIYPKY